MPYGLSAAAVSPVLMEIEDGEVHVFTTAVEAAGQALLDAYRQLLTPEEDERAGRFAFPHLRSEYLVTRALARTVPSRYADRPPAAWQFARNRYGKPELVGPAGARLVRLNLSNTTGMVVCGVTSRADVGIDVEDTGRACEALTISRSHFAPPEQAVLRTLSGAARMDSFFRTWTLKEAYIKARGMGLALPLDQFWFEIEDDDHIRISFGTGIQDDPGAWQFRLLRPSPRHLVAVAVRSGAPVLRVRLEAFVPFGDVPSSAT